jgi:peptide/nickel transport system permease protein
MSLIVFFGVYAIGDPVEILISPEADQIERERAKVALGLDLPLWEQYFVFLGAALQGDLGRSFVFNEPALS